MMLYEFYGCSSAATIKFTHHQERSEMARKTNGSTRGFKKLEDIRAFCECAGGLRLRAYQRSTAQAILNSIRNRRGHSLVVIFPRQSGKNELQAQIEAYLLACLYQEQAEIIKISPTFRPQTLNAMLRLERVLARNSVIQQIGWRKEQGYIYRVGNSRVFFFSGDPAASVVGATASTLLEVDEAQDVSISKYDKDIAPMAASTNATRVFWGTAWTSTTLLAREMRAALDAQQRDGIRRVWKLTADEVGAEVPAYAQFVSEQVTKLGRNNPLVMTQFFSEEIDSQAGMFPAARQALMQGDHLPQLSPRSGALYALLLDVAGEDEDQQAVGEAAASSNTKRDATALTVVEVDLSTLSDPVIKAPRYKVVHRQLWVGVKQSTLYSQLRGLVEHWRASYLVVDATGVGAGLSSFLDKAFPGKVLPFVFSGASKSQLGWDFLGVIESGRYKEFSFCLPSPSQGEGPGMRVNADPIQSRFWQELEHVQMEIVPGPDKRIKWGVPNGMKVDGEFIHDDLVLSAALCAVLDTQEWAISGPALVVQRADPLKELDHGY
jgi:hypothetical protein